MNERSEITQGSTEPNLEGRQAKCAYHGQRTSTRGSYGGGNECNYGQREAKVCTCVQPSSKELPFFEFQGEGSREAVEMCKHCWYAKVAHEKDRRSSDVCTHFEPRGPAQFDKFYCGCAGWD